MNERKKESGESKCEVVEKGVGKKLPRNICICNASKPLLDWSLISFFFSFFWEGAPFILLLQHPRQFTMAWIYYAYLWKNKSEWKPTSIFVLGCLDLTRIRCLYIYSHTFFSVSRWSWVEKKKWRKWHRVNRFLNSVRIGEYVMWC